MEAPLPFVHSRQPAQRLTLCKHTLILFALGSKMKLPGSAREMQRGQRSAPHMSRTEWRALPWRTWTCDGVACPPMAHFCRSAASACNLALSLLSNRSPSVRSTVKSVHDGYSAYAGLVAASKRVHIYASRCANTFKCKFGSSAKDHKSIRKRTVCLCSCLPNHAQAMLCHLHCHKRSLHH